VDALLETEAEQLDPKGMGREGVVFGGEANGKHRHHDFSVMVNICKHNIHRLAL